MKTPAKPSTTSPEFRLARVQEAIITCAGELWGYVGQLTAEAAAEVAAMTIRYWEEGENGDLARYVNLKSNGCQYFMYATHLLGNQILTLITIPTCLSATSGPNRTSWPAR